MSNFFENFDQKTAFFWRALPLKISIYWRIYWHQKWISKNSVKGDPFGRQGVEFLRGRGRAPPPPP